MSFWETLSKIVQTILIMSATGSVITLLLFALKPMIKNRFPKSVQYYLWCLALVAFLVPFSVLVSLPFATPMAPVQNIIETNVKSTAEWQNQIAMELYGVPYTQLDDTEQVNVSYREFKARNIGNYNFLLPYILILGTTYLLKELVQYNIYLFKLKRKRLTARINELNLLPENCPRLFRNPLAATPMLVGLFRPIIYLPDREYSEQQLQNILLHELTHWRRHDVVIKWIAAIAVCMHWFNPLAYFTRREIDRACELACDEAVIYGLDNEGKQNYGNTLIEMAAENKKPKMIVSTTMCEEKKTLKERLGAIMKSKKHSRTIIIFSCVLLAVAFCAIIILGSSANQTNKLVYNASIKELKSITDNYSLDDAKNDGCLVMENGSITSGQETFSDFLSATENYNGASIRVVKYYTLGDKSQYSNEYYEQEKDNYPMLFITDVVFENGNYTTYSFEDGELITKTYKYMIKDEFEANPQATFTSAEYYILANNKDTSWNEIMSSILSSQLPAQIEYFVVYQKQNER